MKKITRRFFLTTVGFGAAALFVPLSWFGRTRERARTTVGGWARRYRRWRYDMEPRWIEMSSTKYVRDTDHFAGMVSPPGPHVYTDAWRELRWPDNDELVERTSCETVVRDWEGSGGGRGSCGVEWADCEMGVKPPESFKGLRHPGELERWAAMAGWDRDEELLVDEDVRRRLDDHGRRFAHDCRHVLERPEPSAMFTEEEEAFLVPALEATRRQVEHERKDRPVSGFVWSVHKLGVFKV